jgi:cellulose synthase/poly-beta-1,6-N-acetylglucosamine synthase-like glycosyltransferase
LKVLRGGRPYYAEPRTYEELEPIARSRKENYLTAGESIDPNDWQPGVTADSIFLRTVKQVEQRNASIILLHDAGGDTRQATVDALPRIIHYFKERGYVFTTVAGLMGKTKNDVMPAVPSSWAMKVNFFFAELNFWGSEILYTLFITGIILSVVRMLAVAVMAALQKRKEKNETLTSVTPKVSIIVPAYNEEVSAVKTIGSLLGQDYPDIDIVFVDDGSADKTFEVVNAAFNNHPRVKVFTKPNGGKASALNFGINQSRADFVVCIDADTQLQKNAVSELMKRFVNKEVGAVAGNVKVGNELNMLTNWQSIEYITAQNFDRRAFDLLNCITVVPGAIGAFRRDAILIAGGFTTDTLAEDCDLTMRLQRHKYLIRNCSSAIAFTEAPENLKGFLKQRFRWSFGIMQSFWKHRDAVFNPKYKSFGMVALPNILIFQMLLPFLAPLADFILLASLVAAGMGIVDAGIGHILFYYLIFTVVDMAGAALAFAFEKADYKKLLWMLPQRFVYRQLMYYVLIKSIRRAIKGELQGWGNLKRTGNVKLEVA